MKKKIIWSPQYPPEGKNGQPGRAGGGIGSSSLASQFGGSILQCDPVGQHFFASWATFLASLATFFCLLQDCQLLGKFVHDNLNAQL